LDHPVRRHVKKNNADIFFSPDGFIPRNLGIPTVAMVHDVAFLRYPEHLPARIRRFYAKWMHRYLSEADHIITVSNFSKSELIAGYQLDPSKISVVNNGVTKTYKPVQEDEKTRVRDLVSNGRPYFLYLGAIHPRKNILTLVRAFEQFKSSDTSDHQLVLAGRPSWQSDTLAKAIQQSPYKNTIHLTGYIAEKQAPGLMASAEALVYPSLYEGFGLPLVEAMACGVPVICSNVSSLPEVAGGAALLFDPLDAGQLALQMQHVITDHSLRKEMIQLGFERVRYFSWDRAAEGIYTVLKRIGKR
jgi:glycosyltransferase involved in cell wall biosynthesis